MPPFPDFIVFWFADYISALFHQSRPKVMNVRVGGDCKARERDHVFLLIDDYPKDKLNDYVGRSSIPSYDCQCIRQVIPLVVAVPSDFPKTDNSSSHCVAT
jgi:hypothetical protein